MIVFVAGALLGAAVASVLFLVLADDEPARRGTDPSLPKASPGTPVAAERALELARRFRPVLRFDSAEPWRPLNIDAFLSEPNQVCDMPASATPRGCRPIKSVDDFLDAALGSRTLGRSHYLDIAGRRGDGADARSPSLGACPDRPARDCNTGPASAIYYNVSSANGRFYIDYWWFLRYNDFSRTRAFTSCRRAVFTSCADHEGDWEGATVVTAAAPPYKLEYTALASHEGVFRYGANELKLEGERPEIYIARGSHAAYPRACSRRRCKQILALGPIRRPEERFDGKAPWGRNADEECERRMSCLLPFPPLDANPRSSWNAFAGRWGILCIKIRSSCPAGKGPKSPSRQARFSEPWCFGTSKRRTCDALTPGAPVEATPGLATEKDCEAWLGQLVAVLACDRNALAGGLRPDRRAGPRDFELRRNDSPASDLMTPGVAQLTGGPLRPGDVVTLSGTAAPSTRLTVRAATDQATIQGRFAGLGLERGGRVLVRVSEREGAPVLSVRGPDGRELEPSREDPRSIG